MTIYIYIFLLIYIIKFILEISTKKKKNFTTSAFYYVSSSNFTLHTPTHTYDCLNAIRKNCFRNLTLLFKNKCLPKKVSHFLLYEDAIYAVYYLWLIFLSNMYFNGMIKWNISLFFPICVIDITKQAALYRILFILY